MNFNIIKIVFSGNVYLVLSGLFKRRLEIPSDTEFYNGEYFERVTKSLGRPSEEEIPRFVELHNAAIKKLFAQTGEGVFLPRLCATHVNMGPFDLRFSSLRGSDLFRCKLPKLSEGIDYSGASLNCCYVLRGAIFKNAIFSGCNLAGFKASGGDFSEAIGLEAIDLKGTKDRDSVLHNDGLDFNEATLNPSQYEFVRKNFKNRHKEGVIRVKFPGNLGLTVDCRNFENLEDAMRRSLLETIPENALGEKSGGLKAITLPWLKSAGGHGEAESKVPFLPPVSLPQRSAPNAVPVGSSHVKNSPETGISDNTAGASKPPTPVISFLTIDRDMD